MQNRSFFILAIAFLLIPLTALAAEDALPKNVIVMIGDGMGVAHVTAARIVKGELHFERCAVGGFSATHSANRLVTDSAAGGTALATGERTNNGMVAMAPDGTPLKTLLEYAEDAGKSTGVVVTCSVTHATPATFLAHVEDRDQQPRIAEQIVEGDADVILGGGWGFFVPKSHKGSERNDEKDLLAELGKRMPVALTPEQLHGLGDVDSFAGMLAPDYLLWAEDRDPSLAEMTSMALDALSKNPNGFALMVEGSHLDWAGHDNDEEHIVAETIDFDKAVGAALDFAEANGETLVVVTADHETGGYTILNGKLEEKTLSKSNFGTGGHSAEMVPLFAEGPGATALGGIHDNDEVGRILIGYMKKAAAASAKEEAVAAP
ncbi:MAG: alkaline phosphatase [Candidatus Hydrogenedentota bacterium]